MQHGDRAAVLLNNSLPYWLKGEGRQNFGDYLTEFFLDRLFYRVGLPAKVTHIIGSVMDERWLAIQPDNDLSVTGSRSTQTIFWGCGLRHEASLSSESQNRCTILSVRGPLSRSALRLGAGVPVGDPALLLPALYRPKPCPATTGRRILVPHFLERQPDDELLAMTGCDMLLRPAILPHIAAIEEFIDQLASAEFVLAGALHAAIVAAAYGRGFGYWDSGAIDIPFKWRDFSASVDIPCVFHPTLDPAQDHYRSCIEPRLKVPPLFPMLAVAPFPVRQDALARVLKGDVERHGMAAMTNFSGDHVQSLMAAEVRAVPSRLLGALLGAGPAASARSEEETSTEAAGSREARALAAEARLAHVLGELAATRDSAEQARAALEVRAQQAEGQLAQVAAELGGARDHAAELDVRARQAEARLAGAQSLPIASDAAEA